MRTGRAARRRALEPARPHGRRRWVHHGSSISHCVGADRPTGTWPVVAARAAGVEVTNLSLAGNCLLDPFVARTIRDQPADLISLKVGINLVNTAAFRLRSFGPAVHGFLDTVREGHPDTPLLVVSPVSCPAVETTPGPTGDDGHGGLAALGDPDDMPLGALTLTVIRDELARIVREPPRPTRTSTTSTAAPSSAPTRPPPSPTASTPTPPPTAASADLARGPPSAPGARSRGGVTPYASASRRSRRRVHSRLCAMPSSRVAVTFAR